LKNLKKKTLDGMCAHALNDTYKRDGVVQIVVKALWKKLGKIIERLGKLVEL
jgi:hypothetical protein